MELHLLIFWTSHAYPLINIYSETLRSPCQQHEVKRHGSLDFGLDFLTWNELACLGTRTLILSDYELYLYYKYSVWPANGVTGQPLASFLGLTPYEYRVIQL